MNPFRMVWWMGTFYFFSVRSISGVKAQQGGTMVSSTCKLSLWLCEAVGI